MACILDVKVVPSAGKQGCVLDKQGKLKCYLKSPPERGLANAELIKLFSKALGVTQTEVEIIAGETSRNKKLKIYRTLTFEQVLQALGIEQQRSLL